ncbi:MAG TPA: CCA tRNA nucleotidyltransferase [Xanthobacteraceae bacterium]
MTTARLDAAWLREPPLSEILAALDAAGEQARIVGGAIRNTLLREARGDVDIATTALPAEVIGRVERAGFKTVPTGIEHGTVTVVADGRPFEVTTLRQDVETFGRRAKVVFGRDWKRDAERRDFTMNALSATRDGAIYDYVGGLADVHARRVRFIGNPTIRIAEDYLRILRFFRFHAAYGEGAPDPDALAACIAARAGLERLSRERIRMEFMRLLTAKGAVSMLQLMSESGLLDEVLAGVPLLTSFARMVALEHTMDIAPDPLRRLGALAVSVTEDAGRLRERLRLANAEHERLVCMGEEWRSVSPAEGEQGGRRLLYRLASEHFVDVVLLAWSRSTADADDQSWRMLTALPARWTAPIFPLKSTHFIRRGIAKGPKLGAAIAAAEKAWMRADFPLDAASLDAIADAVMGEIG